MKFNRYYKEQQKVSYDEGKTWEWLDIYRKGEFVTTDDWKNKEYCERGDDPTPNYPPYSILYSTKTYSTTYDFKINGNSTGIIPQPSKTDELVTFEIEDNLTKLTGLCGSMQNLKSIDFVGEWDTTNVDNMASMFSGCNYLETITGLEKFNTEKVTNMASMFNFCEILTELDLSNFRTSSVTNMGNMFRYCEKVKSIKGVEDFNTDNVTVMSYMFFGCKSYERLNLSNFNTEKVTSMGYMFKMCENLVELNLSNFNTEKVTDVSQMFYGCNSLAKLDLSKFNITKVNKMEYMFTDCTNLNYIKCTQEFKNWCKTNKDTIQLNNYNTITWDIV